MLPKPPLGIRQAIFLVLLCPALATCHDDLGLEEVVYQCDTQRPCASGWLCAAGRCHEAGVLAVSVYGAPAAAYPGLFPFGGCDHLRLCYTSGDDSTLQGCQDFPWTLNAADRAVDFPVPAGTEIRVTAQCMGGAATIATGRSCPESFGPYGGVLQLYLLPRNSIGPTVDASGLVTGLQFPRLGATVTPLPDGRVLIAGGRASENGPPLDSAEYFDPRTGAFSEVGPGHRMQVPRVHARAALLPDGTVAIFGGLAGDGKATAAVELFDPVDGEFAMAPPMALPRVFHTATPLQNSGEVLIVGGVGEGATSYENWTVDEGSESTRPLQESRAHHTAIAVSSGAVQDSSSVVLIVGGEGDEFGSSAIRNTMEVYELAGNHSPEALPLCVLDNVAQSSPSAMTRHEAILVPDGRLCITLGGFADADSAEVSSGTCIWDTYVHAWAGDSAGYTMIQPRARFSAAIGFGVESSSIFISGGLGMGAGTASASSAERLPLPGNAEEPTLLSPQPVPTPLLAPRWDHDAVTLCDGRVLIVGGLTGPSVDESTVTAITEVYNP